MEIIIGTLAFFVGGTIAWLLVSQKTTRKIAILESELNSKNNIANEIEALEASRLNLERDLMAAESKRDTAIHLKEQIDKELNALKQNYEENQEAFNKLNNENATLKANQAALQEKLDTQKTDIEALNKKFFTEFENVANKILDDKSEKFTKSNRTNIEGLLKPLSEKISNFKSKVEEVYDKESKERFSLAERVKELATLNKEISEEAKNLTNALKGEAKTQGGWGEMILESILEKSGLRKDKEYFMEHQLLDKDGKPMRSESEDKKMRPDAVIKYPDNRSVIIDSKVSLNAFTRYSDAEEVEVQKTELKAHVEAIKNHISSLSKKGYDDYDQALDFVIMFVPSEAAYIAAMSGDQNLWSYAYDKRILLMNPTNLITSLKLIEDLWKREYQNENAIEIADRGAKLYDKFVGFVENLEKIGGYIEKAQNSYSEAHSQLGTGNDNLVRQATKLKKLGLKTKKALPEQMSNDSLENDAE
ncbi:MAG: DNA recombination protein RmuC [Crocinitomicaceae bacterium]|nr:DNA recombination protein RmuC [Crocinitomicaceae bacterium]